MENAKALLVNVILSIGLADKLNNTNRSKHLKLVALEIHQGSSGFRTRLSEFEGFYAGAAAITRTSLDSAKNDKSKMKL